MEIKPCTEDYIKTVDAADYGVGGVRIFMDFWHCIEVGYMMMESKAMVIEFDLVFFLVCIG